MNITLKVGAALDEFLPPGTQGTTCTLDVPVDATPASIMSQLGMPLDEGFVVALNGTILTESERGSRALVENDRLGIMPPLKGG